MDEILCKYFEIGWPIGYCKESNHESEKPLINYFSFFR